jgi:hypothetical protein
MNRKLKTVKTMGNRLKMTVIMLIVCITVKANDGSYRSNGGVIYPVNETKISLEKEILSFKVNDRVCQVNIFFEFFNPEQTERKVLVGFQAPYPSGDNMSLSSEYLIRNFQVIKDGAMLPYKVKHAKGGDSELKDTLVFENDEEHRGTFVYLFEVVFKPGKNIINHSYDFPASENVGFNQLYGYILKTGGKWAGGSIKDFTVQIDMDKNSYFFVSDVFGNTAEWSIVGTGKVTDKSFKDGVETNRMVRILSGNLKINVKNFKPRVETFQYGTQSLQFGIINDNSFMCYELDKDRISEAIYYPLCFMRTNIKLHPGTSLTKDDLPILKNAVYAQHCYQFKDKELLKYFSRFEWYLPDPNLSLDKIVLTEKEKKFIDEIAEKSK